MTAAQASREPLRLRGPSRKQWTAAPGVTVTAELIEQVAQAAWQAIEPEFTLTSSQDLHVAVAVAADGQVICGAAHHADRPRLKSVLSMQHLFSAGAPEPVREHATALAGLGGRAFTASLGGALGRITIRDADGDTVAYAEPERAADGTFTLHTAT